MDINRTNQIHVSNRPWLWAEPLVKLLGAQTVIRIVSVTILEVQGGSVNPHCVRVHILSQHEVLELIQIACTL